MKEYGKAEEMLTDALKSSRTLENSAMDVAITYSNLGALYLEMGDIHEQKKISEKALTSMSS